MTQAEALTILKTGANVFLTGEPGAGKTHVINEYVSYLRARGIAPAITASTGIAATHIGGLTIHSWSGLGVRRSLSPYDLDHITQNRNIVRRVANARILIIDEVSMLSARTLSMVDAVCREIRRNREPFGGLQVVLVGDFFQLPPISERGGGDQEQLLASAKEEFAFFSPAWSALNPVVCYLSEQHRQEDAVFLDLLAAIRGSSFAEAHRKILRTRYSPRPKDGITQLYSHNADVDEINQGELIKLLGQEKIFEMEGRGPEKLVAALKRGCLSPEILSLKVGARVMFTKNDVAKHRYVNGTLGTVTDFAKNDDYCPVVKTNSGRSIVVEPVEWHIEDRGRVLARISQVPLRLAWAMTVHKSQGLSLDAAHMDLSQTFEYGQGYVALSRVRTLAGLSLAGLNDQAVRVHPEISQKDGEFRSLSAAAREKFGAIATERLAAMHANFVRACGGGAGLGQKAKLEKKAGSTLDATRELLAQKLSLKEMAERRSLAVGTIIDHLEKLAAEKKINPARDLAHLDRHPQKFAEMQAALLATYRQEQKMSLGPTRELLGDAYSYDELRLARLFIVL